MNVELPFEPNEAQSQFHADAAKYRLLLGAAGSGKSFALCVEDVLLAHEYPGSLGVIFRRYYPSLRDTTKKTFFEVCPPELIKREIKSEGREGVEFKNGSATWFRVLDDYKKLGSTAFDRVSVDEAIEVEEREFLFLIARLRGKVGPRRMMLATNPPDEDHWLFDWFVTQESPDKSVHHSSTYANIKNLAADYVRELEKYPPAWREKYLYGNWGFLTDGKAVFDAFDTQQHVANLRPILEIPVIRGWDFGFRHPACIWLQQTPSGHINWLHELLGTDEDLRTFAGRVLLETAKNFPGCTVEDYCDVAGTQRHDRSPSSVQVLRQEFAVYPFCRKIGLHQSIERMRGLLRHRIGDRPMLQLDASCRISRKAFSGGYRMDRAKDEPSKDGYYDNIVDAGRYPLTAITLPFGEEQAPYSGRALPKWRLAI